MSMTLVIAEKPSVGRDLARVLGCRERQDGYMRGSDGWCVTWAIGHLVSLCEPEELSTVYRKWRMSDLPILPETIPLKILPKTKGQFRIIEQLMKEADDLVCATDAGREGELIFRYVYQMAGCTKPVRRLWISSMTDEAIREGFASLRPESAYDALYQSARCRSEADWLVGMNASRAFTLRYQALLSIGRVQTPTLQILVKRRQEMEAFTVKPYFVIVASFGDYTGVYWDPATEEKRVYTEASAQEIAQAIRGAQATVAQVTSEIKRELPPQLYDLTSLQRDANRLLGFTAQRTLQTAQSLYETHKLLTYPRTDSKYLPHDMAARTRKAMETLPATLQ
ncbi:MAG: DNA topoisomerase, partial [Clostridia bacterium]